MVSPETINVPPKEVVPPIFKLLDILKLLAEILIKLLLPLTIKLLDKYKLLEEILVKLELPEQPIPPDTINAPVVVELDGVDDLQDKE